MAEATNQFPALPAPADHRPPGRRLVPLFVLAPVAAALGYVLAFDPTDRTPDPTGPCVWHATLGIDGPACGGTRMVWYLLHGDLVQAARHHLLALVAVPFLGYAFVQWAAKTTFGLRLPRLRLSWVMLFSYGPAFLLYAVVLRNLPWAPFSWFYVANLT